MSLGARGAAWDRASQSDMRRRQVARLRVYLRDQVLPFSRFYRELFAAHKLTPDMIRTFNDLARIPFTSKKDLLNSPDHPQRARDFVLLPDEAVLRRRPSVMLDALRHGRRRAKDRLDAEYRPIFMTSTTGRSAEPVPFLFTEHDMRLLSEAGRRLIEVFAARPDDRVLNMFPFAPHLAFWQTHYATQAHRLFCVSTGGGKVMGTEGNIRIMRKLKATALIGMPTFLYHFLRQAVDERVRHDSLRMLVLGGEKVPDGMRQKLRSLAADLGSPPVDIVSTYGFTECKMAWAECPCPPHVSPSGYHLYPDMGLMEVVDPKTGQQQPNGVGGEIVYTALDARGTVVLRYRTGDIIEHGLSSDPCPFCGRTVPRLVGRISRQSDVMEMHLDKLKGTIVNFNDLEHALDDLPSIGAWQLEICKPRNDPLEVDNLILHVEKISATDEDNLRDEINEHFFAVTELRLNQIVFHSPAEMRRRHGVGTEIKEKRVVDNRPKPAASGGVS